MQIMEAFLVRTEPDSSIVNPAHIHITMAPQIMNEKVLNTYSTSSSTAACAAVVPHSRQIPTNSSFPNAPRINRLCSGILVPSLIVSSQVPVSACIESVESVVA